MSPPRRPRAARSATAEKAPTRCEIEVEVRYAETDQMGVVHHSNYLVWFELARTRLCALTGVHYADIERRGYSLVVVGIEARYLRGARYGDHVHVAVWVERMTSRSLTFGYEVRRGGEHLAAGTTEHVWVCSGRPCRLPEDLRLPFARLAAGTL